jgi:hypothetical protein
MKERLWAQRLNQEEANHWVCLQCVTLLSMVSRLGLVNSAYTMQDPGSSPLITWLTANTLERLSYQLLLSSELETIGNSQ